MPSVAEEPREGQLVGGRYRLIQPLGAGGMGSVWRATHLGLGVTVAVKFLSQALAGHAEAHARFAREASTAAMVRGRHVVDVLDFGVDELGRPFLAMELLSGEDLANRVVRLGKLPPEQVAEIIEQASRGLAKAHASGVVHRDLKPANLFLTEDEDGKLLVKILDFGVARLDAPGRGLTHDGQLLGTPEFMSPEQARGAGGIDHRSDLFSLAAVAFNALVGRPPFVGAGVGDVIIAVCTTPAPRPTSLDPSLGPAMDTFFERALAKDPAARFASARELARELSAAVSARSSQPAIAAARAPIAGQYHEVRVLSRSSTSVVHLVHRGSDALYVLEQLITYRGADEALVQGASQRLLAAGSLGEASQHAVPVVEVGVLTGQGMTPYIVSEHVQGTDLGTLSRDAPQPPAFVASWLWQAGTFLEAAHQRGMFHCDLRPDRILVELPASASSRARVAGMGMVELLRALASQTETGALRAEPLYAAPEQAVGRARPGPTVDVWSLGLIAFRLLSGRDYWRGGDLMHVLGQLMNEPVVPPSSRGLPLGPAFDAWFLRSCDRNPANRFQTVREQMLVLHATLVGG